MSDAVLREALCALGRSLFERGLTHGSTGNLSVRIDAGYLLTPTGSSLGALDPAQLSLLDAAGRHHALLLANHGPVVSGSSLSAAADAIEELEATAKLWLLVRHERVRLLDAAQLDDLAARYPR